MRAAMNIDRIFDAAPANEILNHPDIHSWVAGDFKGYVDLQPIIDNRDNVVLHHANGVATFIKLQNGFYEMHIAVLPEARGAWVRKASEYCFRYMFTHTDAIELITRCPQNNEAAYHSAVASGMKLEFTTGNIWKTAIGNSIPMDVMTIGINQWTNWDRTIAEEGEWLHKRYDEEFARLGITVMRHAPDANHNRYTGAAVAMIREGQIRKGVGFYNRWAMLAGFSPLEVTCLDPVEITVDGFTMRIVENDFEIVKCPQ